MEDYEEREAPRRLTIPIRRAAAKEVQQRKIKRQGRG